MKYLLLFCYSLQAQQVFTALGHDFHSNNLISTIGFSTQINTSESIFVDLGIITSRGTINNLGILGFKQNLSIPGNSYFHPFVFLGYGSTIDNVIRQIGMNISALSTNTQFVQNYGTGITMNFKGLEIGLGVKNYKMESQTITTPFFILSMK